MAQSQVDEARYSMRVVTRMTGLTADTIRAWERRYGAVTPHRSTGNTRRFTAGDVRRLTLLKEATELGHAISAIATLDSDDIESLIQDATPASPADDISDDLTDDRQTYAKFKDAYLNAVLRFDNRRAADLIMRSATLLEPRDFVFKVVLPIIQEVGTRWAHAELGVAQEHLVTSQLSSLLGSLTRLSMSDRNTHRMLVTTPAGHTHQMGILVGSLLATIHGVEPIYLGPDLPDREIIWAAGMSRADVLLMSVVRDMDGVELDRVARTIESLSNKVRIWIGCPDDHPLIEAAPQATYFHRFEALDLALADLTR